MNNKAQIAERQKVNKMLVEELSNLVEANPHQRFGQILMNYFFSNYDSLEALYLNTVIYNEEPAKTLANLYETYGKLAEDELLDS